jgi:glycosyltransferase involved in cell wall biosynthesis
MMPRVTVVIPCHNGARFLGTAIGSVLAQSCADLEIPVADDASSDDSREIAKRFGPPLRVVRVAPGNTQADRNAAIAVSDSELIALLDQDDAWLPAKVAAQVALLDATPSGPFAGPTPRWPTPRGGSFRRNKTHCGSRGTAPRSWGRSSR